MKRVFLLTSIFFAAAFFSQSLNAQTEAQRVDLCTQRTQGATFQASYIIQFPAQVAGERPQTFRQGIALTRGNRYRFTFCNDDALMGEAVVQIMFNGREIATNYNSATGAIAHTLDFDCTATGAFAIIIRFNDGQEGSAVCIVSHVRTL